MAQKVQPLKPDICPKCLQLRSAISTEQEMIIHLKEEIANAEKRLEYLNSEVKRHDRQFHPQKATV